MANKPFPWMCGECGRTEVRPEAIEYKAEIKHDGKLYGVHIDNLEVPTCGHCGEQWFDVETDKKINATLRITVGLLQPEQILKLRKALGLTQKKLAAKIGVAVASLSRWENGSSIQARSTDKLLRMFFRHPNDPIWEGSDTAPETETAAGSLTDELSEKLGAELSEILAHAVVRKLEYPWRFGDYEISLCDALNVFALERDDEDLRQLTFRVAALSHQGVKRTEAKERPLRRFQALRRQLPGSCRQRELATWFMQPFSSSRPNWLEETLLGSLLLAPAHIDEIIATVRASDFANASYKRIFEGMQECSRLGKSSSEKEWLRCLRDYLAHTEPAAIDTIPILVERATAIDGIREVAAMLRNRSLVREQIKAAD